MSKDCAAPFAADPPSAWNSAGEYWSRIEECTSAAAAPVVALHEPALLWNAQQLVARAAGKPIRVASKSIRVRGVIEAMLRLEGFRGVLAYTLAEALWLSTHIDDIVVGYPTVDRSALLALCQDPVKLARITLMVDDRAQLDLIDALVPSTRRDNIRVCMDLDTSMRIGSTLRFGVLRSPVRTPEEAGELARHIADRPGFELVGVMAYEAQLAGIADAAPNARVRAALIRGLQRRSESEFRGRRRATLAAIQQHADLTFVNAGGTGSLEYSAGSPESTEVTAGSGLYGPHLFDHYRSFRPAPAVAFATDVVRKPLADVATVLGAGWVASGQAGRDRLPVPVWPAGLRLRTVEGTGEVQTPLRGRSARTLAVGDRVWWRHAKAGEVMEHVAEVHVVDASVLPSTLDTYRGEGRNFL